MHQKLLIFIKKSNDQPSQLHIFWSLLRLFFPPSISQAAPKRSILNRAKIKQHLSKNQTDVFSLTFDNCRVKYNKLASLAYTFY